MREIKVDLPSNWIWTRLDCISRIESGTGFPKAIQGQKCGDFPFVKVSDISSAVLKNGCKINSAANYLSIDGATRLGAVVFPVGTTLFAKIGEAIRLNRRSIAAVRVLADNNVMGLMPKREAINSEYLFYFMNTINLYDYTQATTVPSLRKSDINQIRIPLPPLTEQRRIVARIEELLSRLDAGVEALQRAKALLRRYRQAVLKAAVDGRLTEEWRKVHPEVEPAEKLLERIINLSQIKSSKKSRDSSEVAITITGFPSLPESWLWVRLDLMASLKGGITKDAQRRINNGRKIPYLRVANVQRGYLDLSEMKEIEVSEEVISELRLEWGDILFNEGGDRDKLGRGWIWQGELPECIHQNHVFRARLYSNQVSSKFVSWFGNTYGQEYFLKEGKQTTNLASINLTKLSAFPVPLPPNEEQNVIVEVIETCISMANESEKNIDQSLKHANRLRQSILKRAFEGKLVSQDTNDEPAKLLLERIEANKKKQIQIKETKYRNKNSRAKGKNREINLYELLRSSIRNLTPSELWVLSKLDIEDFYCRLKLEIEKGRIIEDKINNKLIVKDETT